MCNRLSIDTLNQPWIESWSILSQHSISIWSKLDWQSVERQLSEKWRMYTWLNLLTLYPMSAEISRLSTNSWSQHWSNVNWDVDRALIKYQSSVDEGNWSWEVINTRPQILLVHMSILSSSPSQLLACH